MAKRQHPTVPRDVDDNASQFFAALSGESDRGCAIVAAAFIEDALEVLLRASMSRDSKVVKSTIDPLFKGIGPLSSSWAKAEMCRAMRLVSESVHADLALIRGLRNQFAHTYLQATFDDSKVVAIVSKFHVFGWDPSIPGTRLKKPDGATQVRKSFMCAAGLIAGSLIHAAKQRHAV